MTKTAAIAGQAESAPMSCGASVSCSRPVGFVVDMAGEGVFGAPSRGGDEEQSRWGGPYIMVAPLPHEIMRLE